MINTVTSLTGLDVMPPSWAALGSILIILSGIVITSWAVNSILKKYIVKFIAGFSERSNNLWFQRVHKYRSFRLLSHLAPAWIIYFSITLLKSEEHPWTNQIIEFTQVAMKVYMTYSLVAFLRSLLSVTQDWYKAINPNHPFSIRTYIQVLHLFLWSAFAISAFTIVTGKSPTVLLTSLGALSAILLLVFRDSIIGFVSSIQVSLNDMVCVGDWITIPSQGVDGDVLDVSINTVKIRNFDNTIATIPTQSLITEAVQNWRGMKQSGGRRIKRSINIDIDTIAFADNKTLEKLGKMKYMNQYISSKSVEIEKHNIENSYDPDISADGRNLTNVGLFRAYIEEYLRSRPDIHKEMTFLVRQLEPTEKGLPIEIYVFTNNTHWVTYEGIQADIFDHLLAALDQFDLKAFQLHSSQTRCN